MAAVNRFETPLLRVSRPVSACQRCRNAKVKCDGKLPACTACERVGRSAECSSANDPFARGKERSYVASLENRVEKLERQIAQAKARKATTNTLDIVSAQPFLAPPVAVTSHGGGRAGRKETQDVNDLVSDFGFLSVNATARDFHGFTRQMSYARLVLSTSSKESLPVLGLNGLPPRHASTLVIKHYLENVHTLYPFLSETKLFAAVNAVYQNNGRDATHTDHWTTRMVLAIAYASMSRRNGDAQYQDGLRHATAALERIEYVLHPGSVPGLQAILLLVLYAMLDPLHFNSWYLIGLASRAMVDLGIHQDPPKELRLKEADVNTGRRVYASIYALDRSISMIHRRGFSFTDDSAGITSPLVLSRQEGRPSGKEIFSHSLEAAAQLEHLRQIQSAAYQQLFQSGLSNFEDAWPVMSRALYDMNRWTETLPQNLSEIQLKSLKKLFRSDILYSSILFLSPVLAGTLSDYGRLLIFEYAAEFADLMASASAEKEQSVFFTYYNLLSASFVADRFIQLLYQDSNIVFNDITPQAPLRSVPPNGPSTIPARTIGERVNRAHGCLTQLERTLGYLGPRFGFPDRLDDFKARSSAIRHTLQTVYDNWTRSLGVSRNQYVNPALAPIGGFYEP